MSNNYLKFSEELDRLTSREMDWWVSILDEIDRRLKDADLVETGPFEDEEWEWIHTDFVEAGCIDFRYVVKSNSIFFYAEEHGNPAQVCNLVQQFFNLFRPDGQFHITWAEYCDRPKIGHARGGAAAVTKDTISWLSADSWLDNEFESIQALSGG